MKQVMQFFVNIWNAQRNAEALFDAGINSEVVGVIREILTVNGVPVAAFIDDHVKNAIWQRNEARKEADALRQQISKRGAGGRFVPKSDPS
jgi:hypothetical protein